MMEKAKMEWERGKEICLRAWAVENEKVILKKQEKVHLEVSEA